MHVTYLHDIICICIGQLRRMLIASYDQLFATGIPLGQELNPQYAGAGLFLWIGVFLVAAIGYGSTQDARFYGEVICLLNMCRVFNRDSSSLHT